MFVLDNSVVLSWCREDETNPLAEQPMHHVIEYGAIVPGDLVVRMTERLSDERMPWAAESR